MSVFKDSELILVGGRELATIGGRLRLAHEANEKLTIKTEIVDFVLGTHAVVRAEVTTTKGTFTATGVATATADARLVDTLLSVAETRSLARALRFASFGFEVGVEELGDAALAANTVPDARGQVAPPRMGRLAPVDGAGQRRQRGGTPATTAQKRCIDALARRVHVDPGALVARFAPGLSVEDLSIGDASRVIDAAKRTAGTNGDGGGHA
jgi:hypothetical protein